MITPGDCTIRAPSFALAQLRRLGAFRGKTNRLLPLVYKFLRPEFDALTARIRRRGGKAAMDGIRRLLGPDLSGPAWVICSCKECQRKKAEADRTPLPGRNLLDEARVEDLIRELVRKRKY